MMETLFESLPLWPIFLCETKYPTHDLTNRQIATAYVLPEKDEEPVWAERLVDGSWYIHKGRDRVLRGKACGDVTIVAHVLVRV